MHLFQVKMIQKGTKPPVWRRGRIPSDITFSQLALLLEEMLDCRKTDSYEFSFYQARVRINEWEEGKKGLTDYYYDYMSAADTFVNELLGAEDWFTFKAQTEEGKALQYRIEMEKVQEKPRLPQEGQRHELAPVIVKQVGSENDWSNLQTKNELLAADYALQQGAAEYKGFRELLAAFMAGERGLTVCSGAVSRTEHNKKSANTMLGEFVDNLLLPYQEEIVKRLQEKTRYAEAELEAMPEEEAERLYTQISGEIEEKMRAELPKRLREKLYGDRKDRASRQPRVKDMLQSYAKDDLIMVAKELKLRHTGLRKEELAEKLANEILTPRVMEQRLVTLGDEEIHAFERAMERACFFPTEQEWDALEAFFDMDYIVIYEDDYVEVPEEVTAVYNKINSPDFQKNRREVSWMLECLRMFMYIYVVAPVDVVWQMYRSRKGFRVSQAEFLSIFEKVPKEDNPCTILGEEMVLTEVLKDNLYLRIAERQREVAYYIPSEEEIHDYAKNAYPSKDSVYRKLKGFLTEELKCEESEADYLCREIYREITMRGGSLSDIADMLCEEEIEFQSDEQFAQFANMVMEVNNRTRMFELRGHTPNEMRNMAVSSHKPVRPTIVPMSSMAAEMLSATREDLQKRGISVDTESNAAQMPVSYFQNGINGNAVTAMKKVYPNDPCPCGSGKKYKKCCGRQ